ncbi:MAG: Dihydropteroate synthase [Candidatus Angelobacter sp.]|jgi:dihydropteroate synthase|nr:Dihydropteroate synthase [Candidatus Angelobacter sp.]
MTRIRPEFQWQLKTRTLALGERTLVMGVVNVTPDSFSDGGQFLSQEKAIEHALRLLGEGADIIDVGGESTRPGQKEPVTAEMELERVLPVIEAVLKEAPRAVISVDTYKSEVARAAVAAGAEIVNDVSGLRWNAAMASTIARLKCGVALMHMRGRPEGWRNLPPLTDAVALVKKELGEIAESAMTAGIARERIMLDPGFGFGKNYDENYPLLAQFDELHELGFPLLSGTSRKSFIGKTISGDGQRVSPEGRLHGSLATLTASILKGAHVVRVHDVKPAVEAARVADAILAATT